MYCLTCISTQWYSVVTKLQPNGLAFVDTLNGFLLTRQWRDNSNGLELAFWFATDRGPLKIIVDNERAVCFVSADSSVAQHQLERFHCERRPLTLVSLSNTKVDGLYFRFQRDLLDFQRIYRSEHGILYESDIKPVDRFLMERFITNSCQITGVLRENFGHLQIDNPSVKQVDYDIPLSCLALDIETEGLSGALYSIGFYGCGQSRVLMVSDYPVATAGCMIEVYPDEKTLLSAFFEYIQKLDPDVLVGWNLISFDLEFLATRCQRLKVEFALGRGGDRAAILRPQKTSGFHVARIPGRVVIDVIDALRAAFWSFENFHLETVAQSILGRGKTLKKKDKVTEISRLFNEDKAVLAQYNIEDCRLTMEIFEHAKLLRFAIRRAQFTGLPMDRFGGSVAAFDNLYLPRLHRKGRVAPDVQDMHEGPSSPGGYVIESKPGLYDNVLVLDFKSLYPSIIRTFQVDPYALAIASDNAIPGFVKARFSRQGAILPELIAELWSEREAAKKVSDHALSQAVKILMNSFYGVLAAQGCRFYDHRLASSITMRGHEIIQRSKEFVEEQGFTVIYGDTDSVFVLPGETYTALEATALGQRLAEELTTFWSDRLIEQYKLDSYLEVEFETHYARFLMPTVRGEQQGSKKRYAGLVRTDKGNELIFKGLETVRGDWTPLAREFQRELYRRVFLDEPYKDFVKDTRDALMAGRLDEKLVYRKRVMRPITSYIKNVPPHVQAAKKLGREVKSIEYLVTVGGPEPIDLITAKADYIHYLERQLAPVADGILTFLGQSFDSITSSQLEIF